MNFHAKALLAFIAFHVIVTGGGLMFDHVPQALDQGASDNDAQLVGAVVSDVVDGRAGDGVPGAGGLKAGEGELVAIVSQICDRGDDFATLQCSRPLFNTQEINHEKIFAS